MVVCSILCGLHLIAKLVMASAKEERTFIMVKPDGVQRGLVGEIMRRFEAKGFKLVALKFVWVRKHCSLDVCNLHVRFFLWL